MAHVVLALVGVGAIVWGGVLSGGAAGGAARWPSPPRAAAPGTVALFDAALRLCARTRGVWALTLPGGAAVMAALLHLSGRRGRTAALR